MSRTKHAKHKPSAIEDAPKVGEDGKVKGLGCAERVPGTATRRDYKKRAGKKRRKTDHKVEKTEGFFSTWERIIKENF